MDLTGGGEFITFGGRSAHLAYHVLKSGRKTSLIIIIIMVGGGARSSYLLHPVKISNYYPNSKRIMIDLNWLKLKSYRIFKNNMSTTIDTLVMGTNYLTETMIMNGKICVCSTTIYSCRMVVPNPMLPCKYGHTDKWPCVNCCWHNNHKN